jgi:hypothetical protein
VARLTANARLPTANHRAIPTTRQIAQRQQPQPATRVRAPQLPTHARVVITAVRAFVRRNLMAQQNGCIKIRARHSAQIAKLISQRALAVVCQGPVRALVGAARLLLLAAAAAAAVAVLGIAYVVLSPMERLISAGRRVLIRHRRVHSRRHLPHLVGKPCSAQRNNHPTCQHRRHPIRVRPIFLPLPPRLQIHVRSHVGGIGMVLIMVAPQQHRLRMAAAPGQI